MKKTDYMLGFSLLIFLGLGFLSVRTSQPKVPDVQNPVGEAPVIDSMDSLVIARDINLYTHEAAAIVVGEVGEVHSVQDSSFQKNAIVEVEELLKGDTNMSQVTVLTNDSRDMEDSEGLRTGEHVLLFLGKDGQNNYVIFAGPNGKYLIDETGNVSSAGDFKMPLVDLESKIKEALE